MEDEAMPWFAQRADLPDTHKHHADAGSDLARTFAEGLGYVEVPAPGHTADDDGEVDDFGDKVPPVDGEIPPGDTYDED